MKFTIENLGLIQHADIEPGDLTIVCGRNNNGKTYLTYTLGTFFGTIKHNVDVPLEESKTNELFDRGETVLKLDEYVDRFIESVHNNVLRFKHTLPRFLAMHPDRFAKTSIDVDISREEILSCLNDMKSAFEHSEIKVSDKFSLCFERKKDDPFSVIITMLNKSDELPSRRAIEWALSFMIARIFDGRPYTSIFPETFVITCERTGTMLFRQELISIRKKMDENYPKKITGKQLNHGNVFQRPVEWEIDFVLNLGAIQNNKSVIAESHPEIFKMLAAMSGGEYKFDAETNQVRFVPMGNSSVPLSLPESSSAVRSLAELYFYLKHRAEPGQMLMFDEPELNLHPANQRILARLLAALVNAGVKVFITTHSDYIIREFNALIRLGKIARRSCKELLRKFEISQNSMLDADMVKIYMLGEGRTREIEFDSDSKAFGVPSFDDTIDQFNMMYTDVRNLDVLK